LDSYRRAFKLDPDIDYAYKKHYQKNILPKIQENKDKPEKPVGGEDFKHIVPLGKEYTASSNATREDPLASLIQAFLDDPELKIIPILDYKPLSIAKLPSKELLYMEKGLYRS
jgi:F-box protein 9